MHLPVAGDSRVDAVRRQLRIQTVDHLLSGQSSGTTRHGDGDILIAGRRSDMERVVLRVTAGQERNSVIVESHRIACKLGSAAGDACILNAERGGINRVIGAAQIDRHLGVCLGAATADVRYEISIVGSAGVEIDVRRLAVYFVYQPLVLCVQCIAVAGERCRCRFRGQRTQPVENGGYVVEAAIHDLQRADAIVGVQNALIQLRDIAAVLVSDREPRRIVRGGIDTVAGRELLNGVTLKVVVDANEVLSFKRCNVGLNGDRHLASFSEYVPDAMQEPAPANRHSTGAPGRATLISVPKGEKILI